MIVLNIRKVILNFFCHIKKIFETGLEVIINKHEDFLHWKANNKEKAFLKLINDLRYQVQCFEEQVGILKNRLNKLGRVNECDILNQAIQILRKLMDNDKNKLLEHIKEKHFHLDSVHFVDFVKEHFDVKV